MGSVVLLKSLSKEQAVSACAEWGFQLDGTRADLIGRLENGLAAAGLNPDIYDFASKSELVPRSTLRSQSGSASLTLDVPPPNNFSFSPESNIASRWEKWLNSFNIYVSALGGDLSPTRKSALLLHVAGAGVQELKETLVIPHDDNEGTPIDSFNKLILALNKYFRPRKSKKV